MDKVIKILMERDKCDEQTARDRIELFQKDAEDYICRGMIEDVESLLMNELGLEPDYIPDLIY